MKSKTLISRLALGIMLSAALGLTAHTQTSDTITLKVRQFDSMVQDIEIEKGQNEAFRKGFDSLKTWYTELAQKYEQSQANLAACMRERDTAHAYIDALRTQISRVMTDRDKAAAEAVAANNRKKKAFGIGISTGYNPFTRLPYAGVGISWNIIRFSLRGLFDSDTKAATYNPTIYSTLNH